MSKIQILTLTGIQLHFLVKHLEMLFLILFLAYLVGEFNE
jgi:hypothetical protein